MYVCIYIYIYMYIYIYIYILALTCSEMPATAPQTLADAGRTGRLCLASPTCLPRIRS